jgi:hypothetical protein
MKYMRFYNKETRIMNYLFHVACAIKRLKLYYSYTKEIGFPPFPPVTHSGKETSFLYYCFVSKVFFKNMPEHVFH